MLKRVTPSQEFLLGLVFLFQNSQQLHPWIYVFQVTPMAGVSTVIQETLISWTSSILAYHLCQSWPMTKNSVGTRYLECFKSQDEYKISIRNETYDRRSRAQEATLRSQNCLQVFVFEVSCVPETQAIKSLHLCFPRHCFIISGNSLHCNNSRGRRGEVEQSQSLPSVVLPCSLPGPRQSMICIYQEIKSKWAGQHHAAPSPFE